MTDSDTNFLKPLALVFQETDQDSVAITKALERLELRVERFTDPRTFLLQIRRQDAGLCFIDASTPKTDVAIAVMKTITSFFGKNTPMLVLVRGNDQKTVEKVVGLGARAVVEKPLQLLDLAKKLSAHVVTNAISAALGGKFPPEAGRSPDAAASAPAEELIPKVPIPEMVGWHFEKMLPVLAELSAALDVFESVEEQLKFYAQRLLPRHEQVEKMVQTLRKSKEKLDLLQSLRMYGAANARNLVAAFALSDATKSGILSFSEKTGMLSSEPAKVIPCAAKAVEVFGEGSRYQQVAFNSGLVFDLLALVCESVAGRKVSLGKFLQSCYSSGMKRAEKGFRMGKQVSDLALDRHIISALMMREAGRVAMAIYYQDYLDLCTRFEKKGVKPVLQHVVEQDRYSISHNLIGALLCQATPGLGAAYKSVLFCDYPFMLKTGKGDADTYALARLCQSL